MLFIMFPILRTILDVFSDSFCLMQYLYTDDCL